VRPGNVAFGFVASWIYRPIGLNITSPDPEGANIYAVEHAVSAHLLATIGVTSRLAFDIDAPFTMFQSGASTSVVTGSDEELPRSAVGDLRFGPTIALFHRGGVDVAARLHVTAPTGNPRGFASSASATFGPGVSFAYSKSRFRFAADAGARIRKFAELGGAIVGNQVSTGIGASYDVLPASWLTIGAELFALFTLEQQVTQIADAASGTAREEPSGDPLIPAEWLLTFRTGHFAERRLRLTMGIGGLVPTGPTSDMTAPSLRAIASIAFVPSPEKRSR
jgi:hypothetical protein